MEKENFKILIGQLIKDREFADEIKATQIIENIKSYSPILLCRFLILTKDFCYKNFDSFSDPILLNSTLNDFFNQSYKLPYDKQIGVESWQKFNEVIRLALIYFANSDIAKIPNEVFECIEDTGFIQDQFIADNSSYQYLKKKVVKTENNNKPQKDNKEKQPTLREIALQYYYLGNQITRANDNEIAKQYGYKSGGKLYQLYTHYCQKAVRTHPEETEKKNNNKIEIFEKVILLLNDKPSQQQTAKKDLILLQDNTKNTEF